VGERPPFPPGDEPPPSLQAATDEAGGEVSPKESPEGPRSGSAGGPSPGRRWLVDGLGALAVLGGWAICALDEHASDLPEWAGTALILLGAWGLSETLRAAWRASTQWLQGRSRARQRLARFAPALPFALVTLVTLAALWPIPAGTMPVSQDHAHHYVQVRVLLDDLLAHGHLFGWTDRISTGLPFGDVYGTGAYLLPGALTALTGGWVPLPVSYALGITLGWLFLAWAVTAWTRRLVGGWLGPTLAGVLVPLDVGGDRQAGWVYSMFHGVWQQLAGTGLWVLALLALIRLAERHSPRRLGAAALVTGAAAWVHPMSLINLVIAAPILVALLMLAPGDPHEDAHRDRRWGAVWVLVALGLAALIARGWVAHAAVGGEEALKRYTTYWGSVPELVLKALKDQLFYFPYTGVTAAALLGFAVALVRRRWFDVLTLLLVAGVLVGGSLDVLAALDLGGHEKFKPIMATRLAITLKPLWFALAGLGAAAALQGARAAWAALPKAPLYPAVGIAGDRGRATTTLVLIVGLAPLAHGAAEAIPRFTPSLVGHPITAEHAGVTEALPRLREILTREAARLGPDRPHRVGVWYAKGEHGHYHLLPIADTGFGYLPSKSPPAQAFKWINARKTSQGMRWLGASLLITMSPQKFTDATLVEEVGPYYVYRLTDEPTWPAEVQGGGRVEVLSWTDQERRLRLTGTTKKSRLVLGFPPYRKWHAYEGERELAMHRVKGKFGYTVSSSPDIVDGEVRVVYEDTPKEERAARWAWVALALALVALALGAKPRLPAPSFAALRWAPAVAGALTLLVAVAAVVVVVRAQASSRNEGWVKPRPLEKVHVVTTLHDEEPVSFTYEPEHYCVRAFSRNPRATCDERSLQPHLALGPMIKDRQPACVQFGVPDKGHAELTYTIPAGVSELRGTLQIVHGARTKTKATARFGHGTVGIPNNAKRFVLSVAGHAGEPITFRVDNKGSTAFACLAVVGLAPGAPKHPPRVHKPR